MLHWSSGMPIGYSLSILIFLIFASTQALETNSKKIHHEAQNKTFNNQQLIIDHQQQQQQHQANLSSIRQGNQRALNLEDNAESIVKSKRQLGARLQSRKDGGEMIPGNDDTRIPFWNIAHMINSIPQINNALGAGANGIETDVSFDSNGVPVEAYHGFPCDCGRHCHHREDFVKFVRQLAKITNPPAQNSLQVVLFDLKLKDLKEVSQKEIAGRYLAKIIYENLYLGYEQVVKSSSRTPNRPESLLLPPPVRVIMSINHASDSPLARSFINYMREHRLDLMNRYVGFDVGMNDNLTEISSMWDSMNGATFNIWQGDGLTNCANIIRGVDRLKEAVTIRNGQGHFRKVYYWTADVLYHIRSVLRLGLDAVLTNQPQRVLQVLNEPEFSVKYRLATPYDDPFEQFWIQPSAWKMSPPTLGEAVETVANIHKTSEEFVKTLPDGITAVIKKVHHSIASAIR